VCNECGACNLFPIAKNPYTTTTCINKLTKKKNNNNNAMKANKTYTKNEKTSTKRNY
jgi:hypothetical protein